ncbi:MAG: DEAD/DEAH box helicase [Candidatus Thorarchaeota archaeon]|jgi:SWI/SNF-related matrix-associated actin-dependent regulator 1 of chromatin subfamily A
MRINGYRIIFSKSNWSIREIETAYCLGFDVAAKDITADIRVTSKKALKNFMRMAYSTFPKSIIEKLSELYGQVESEFKEIYTPELSYPNRKLKDHQIEAIKEMAHRQYNLLAFTMGLGKTITSISISKMMDFERTLIVCPALVKWNWFRELSEDWGFNALEFTMLDAIYDQSFQAINEKFVIVNFEMIQKWQEHIVSKPFDHVIVDEAHNIKNPDTKRHRLVGRVLNKNPKARVTLLTGTPITNRVDDLFGYLTLFNHHLGRSKRSFINRYTVGSKKEAINTNELRINLSNCMIRKKTSECIDLPELRISKYHFNIKDFGNEYLISKQKVEMARDQVRQIKKRISKGDKDPSLKSELNKQKMIARSNIHSLNRIASEYKVPGVCHLADSIIRDGRKVIIFSPYRNTLKMLQDFYKNRAVTIDGSVPPKEKQKRIQDFINKPKVKVFIGQVQAAGVGINLVNSSDVIFNGFPFTPDSIEQPIKRAHRMGQVKDVNVYFTIANGSYDQHIYNIVASKLNEINDTIDHDKSDVMELDTIDNQELKDILQ